MIINRKPRNKSYWRWRRQFAFFPVRMLDTKQLIWFETYYKRTVFDPNFPVNRYTTSKTPLPVYDDDRVKLEGAAQIAQRIFG